MNQTTWPLTVLMFGLAAAGPLAAQGPPRREIIPAPSTDILFNPGMGLYLQYPTTDAAPAEWFMKVCDIAYYRLDWNDVNPEAGKYTFDEYFAPLFDFWVKQRGKRLALRVMCESMHSGGAYVTPKWVFDQGVPGVPHQALSGETQTDPVFWDDRYLDLQCAFIRRLGEYLADKPGLEFVDIGSIGEWGEMHLARWTPEQLEQTGFSEYRYARAYRRVIDAYAQAFPHTRVFLNVGGQEHLSIMDYAALRGVHFRQDGLTPDGASYDVGEWLYKPYARRGVICNFEFHSGYDEMVRKGWDVKATLDRGLSAPISYLNTNLFGGGGYRQAPTAVQELLADAARRIGYRFVLTRLRCPAQARLVPGRAARLPLEATWRNDGVAPCYDSLAVRWSLADAAGKVVAEDAALPRLPTTQWWPGEKVEDRALMRLPADLAPGEYRLRVTMFSPETAHTIMLGLAGHQADGSYDLGPMVAAAAPDEQVVAYETGFEAGAAPWSGAPGTTAALATEGGRDSHGCLLVSGTVRQDWNYASFRVPGLVPYSKYRLTAWMLVEQADAQGPAPYLKLGVNAADDKWIANYNSAPYDLKQLGTWQKLSAIADLPPEATSGDIALEKGDNTTAVTVKLRLDDVKLELVEGP
jgi:hypothetical protein